MVTKKILVRRIILVLGLLVTVSFNLLANQLNSVIDSLSTRYIKKAYYHDSLNSFKLKYGNNKVLNTTDSELVLAFYVALKYYPELKMTPISLDLKPINSTMQSQPCTYFLFQSKENRNYNISICNIRLRNGIYFKDLSFNALIGWIGHELAHISYYQTINNYELLKFVIHYSVSSSYKKNIERQTDLSTINHHLGYSLYEGEEYAINSLLISKEYKQKLIANYLSPTEILQLINY